MKVLTKYIMGVAAKSNVEQRKVGCILVYGDEIVGEGYNVSEEGELDVHAEIMACEDLIATGYISSEDFKEITAYVTHAPCPACAKVFASHGIHKIELIEAFMKFDGDKTRYDLVDGGFGLGLVDCKPYKDSVPRLLLQLEKQLREPVNKATIMVTTQITSAVMEHFGISSDEVFTDIAEVLTFGARKYKPNNWRQCDDYGRYLAAAWRHWFAVARDEELDDPESGLRHVAHLMTNIMFLHTKLVQIRDEKR